jgi:hypothetical protein
LEEAEETAPEEPEDPPEEERLEAAFPEEEAVPAEEACEEVPVSPQAERAKARAQRKKPKNLGFIDEFLFLRRGQGKKSSGSLSCLGFYSASSEDGSKNLIFPILRAKVT